MLVTPVTLVTLAALVTLATCWREGTQPLASDSHSNQTLLARLLLECTLVKVASTVTTTDWVELCVTVPRTDTLVCSCVLVRPTNLDKEICWCVYEEQKRSVCDEELYWV